MNHSDLVHVIDFRNKANCNRIESAEPGEELEILVRLEAPHTSPSVRARGWRSLDGESFEVTVPTRDGPEAHSWTWEFLMACLPHLRESLRVR
jgi:hypothetical protein